MSCMELYFVSFLNKISKSKPCFQHLVASDLKVIFTFKRLLVLDAQTKMIFFS